MNACLNERKHAIEINRFTSFFIVFSRDFMCVCFFIDYANEVINFHSQKSANKVSTPILSIKLYTNVFGVFDFKLCMKHTTNANLLIKQNS